MRHDPDEVDRMNHEDPADLIDTALNTRRPLLGSRDHQPLHGCPNPNCLGSWHGRDYNDCPGSWHFNDDGTRRDAPPHETRRDAE